MTAVPAPPTGLHPVVLRKVQKLASDDDLFILLIAGSISPGAVATAWTKALT